MSMLRTMGSKLKKCGCWLCQCYVPWEVSWRRVDVDYVNVTYHGKYVEEGLMLIMSMLRTMGSMLKKGWCWLCQCYVPWEVSWRRVDVDYVNVTYHGKYVEEGWMLIMSMLRTMGSKLKKCGCWLCQCYVPWEVSWRRVDVDYVNVTYHGKYVEEGLMLIMSMLRTMGSKLKKCGCWLCQCYVPWEVCWRRVDVDYVNVTYHGKYVEEVWMLIMSMLRTMGSKLKKGGCWLCQCYVPWEVSWRRVDVDYVNVTYHGK